MNNRGILGDRISDTQYKYLLDNYNSWHNNITVVFVNNNLNTVFIDWYNADTGYYEMDQIVSDGTVTHSRSNDPTNYRSTVWNGTPGSYIYLYGNNGYVTISSKETLNIPSEYPLLWTLTDGQYEWLKDNYDYWNNLNKCTIAKAGDGTTVEVMNMAVGVSDRIADLTISADGSATLNNRLISDTTTYWYKIYNKLYSNQFTYFKNWGDDQIDSHNTIGIPEIEMPDISTDRIVIDIEDMKAVKDTNWTWYNLFNVLAFMPEVEAIPTDPVTLRNLAYEWDSNMSYRIFTPYMMGWVKGIIQTIDIANYLKTMFKDKWNKMWDVLHAEYNPLDNYDMNEEEHTDDVKDEANTSEGETTTSNESSSENHDKVFAYNSSTASDDSESSSSSEDSGGSTSSSSGTYTTDNDLDRTLSRHGNIGVKTTQSLIEEELKLRENIVLDTIKDDIIKVMTLPYYGGKY